MRIKQLIVVAIAALLALGNAQQAIGQEVDMKKYPDYKPFDPALQRTMPQKNTRGVAKSSSTATRPDHLNNALSMFYPPVFNQSGGSCGSAQAIGYIFTHDMNNMRNLDASFEENQYPSHFTWLFTTAGVEKVNIGVGNGIPNVATYGGRTFSNIFGKQDTKDYYFGWMQGYDKWYSAMFNRFLDFFYGPRFTDWLGAREQVKQWLWNHWGEEGYIEGGCVGFGVASAVTSYAIPSTAINDELGVSGKQYVHRWGKTYDHGLTICGYDDRIEFDLDGDGVYGEEDADEKGAWIICNSWGSSWKNQGFIYCPYAHSYSMVDAAGEHTLPWATELYHYRHNYRPLRTIKVLMDYDHRWELSLSGGIAQDTSAIAPEAVTPFSHFQTSNKFDNDGVSPEVPMLGRWSDGFHYEPMEFGYDLTDLGDAFDSSKPLKYFFIVKTRDGSVGKGHLYSASIMNYDFDKEDPVEIPFKIDTLSINEGGVTLMVSVVVPGEGINPPLNAALNGTTLTWDAPIVTSLPISKYYIYNGGTLIDSTGITNRSYSVSNMNSAYSVAAVYKHGNMSLTSERSNNASNPIQLDNSDNKILTLNGGGITIPNVLKKKLNEATIEFMFKPTALGASYNKVGSTDGKFFVNVSASGQVVAGWSTNNNNDYAATAASVVKVGKWYHVAVTVNKNEVAIYIDGMRKKSSTSASYSGIPAIDDLVLGLEDGLINGSIDEVRVWKTVRSMTEIFGGKDDAISNPSSLTDLLTYLPMETIEDDNELKIRDFAGGNHAYFNNANYALAQDASILTGSKLNINPAIVASQDSATAGTPVKYTAVSPLSTTSWEWSAPGAQSETYTSQSPYIIYNTAGEHTISLTITKADGSTMNVEKPIFVREATKPVVDFDMSANENDAGEQFSFINRSTSANTSYVWTLNGAQTETIQATNATAVYDLPGNFTVTLTGTNAGGSTSVSKTVKVNAAAPKPAFSVSPTTIVMGENTYLVDRSRGGADNWTWMLDNGKHLLVVNGQNSSYSPKYPGIYDVSLIASNDVGQRVATQKKLLYVSNADAKNSLSFDGNEKVNFQCPLSKSSKAWTIEWWMNPKQYTGAGCFATDNGFFNMHGEAGGEMKISINGSSASSSTGYIILNEWHHYAVTYSLGTIRFYRDGELISSPTAKLTYSTGNWEGNMTISDSETPFKGLIDELRIWSKTVTASNIKLNSNAPIADPTNTAGLVLYYNFNDGSGDVKDQSVLKNNGVRSGFGPDGDAWPIAPGVFTLDLDNSVNETTDVTSQYLTNYKRPFIYDANTQVNNTIANRFYALETNTAESGWQIMGAQKDGNITTGAHVNAYYSYDLCFAVGYDGFANSISNNRVFQTITLPAGKYTLSVTKGSSIGSYPESYLVATKGAELSDNSNYTKSLAYAKLGSNTAIEFLLADETEVSLGMLYNASGNCRYNISQITLTRQDIDMVQADGETSVYDAIEAGNADVITPRDGGVVIASKIKENFRIYTVEGKCVFNDDVHGVHFIPLESGVYIANGQKVVVK